MDIRIACRNDATHTTALDTHIKQKLGKIVTFLERHQGPATIDIMIEGHPSHAHNKVRAHVVSPEFEVIAEREGNNLHPLIDEVIDIVYKSLHLEKEKQVHARKNRGPHRGV